MPGFPQGSVLVPLLFNICINDLFYLINISDVCNYADDTTLYSGNLSLDLLMSKLQNSAQKALDWVGYNYMKLNPGKCHILVCGANHETMIGSIGSSKIIESHKIKLSGIEIDRNIKFEDHVSVQFFHYTDGKMLMKAFITSQFSHCSSAWMFCSSELNSKINGLPLRALKIVYRDNLSTFFL